MQNAIIAKLLKLNNNISENTNIKWVANVRMLCAYTTDNKVCNELCIK